MMKATLPTPVQAQRYVYRRRSQGSDERLPTVVWAPQRWAAEFPRLVILTEDHHYLEPGIWWSDLRLELGDGRLSYRVWAVRASGQDQALEALQRRASELGAVQLTIYSLRSPPDEAAAQELAAANKALRGRIHGQG